MSHVRTHGAGPDYEDVFYHADQLIKGMYSVFMSDWLEAFPREAVLVVRAEDYYADNKATLQTVYAPCRQTSMCPRCAFTSSPTQLAFAHRCVCVVRCWGTSGWTP